MPAGPALLAATTGAALLPVGLWFTAAPAGGSGSIPRCRSPGPSGCGTPCRPTTQEVAHAFAADIAQRPHDWHMFQRLWLEISPPVPHAGTAIRRDRRRTGPTAGARRTGG